MRQRIRLTFRKVGALRFISHHDLMRTFERVLRRAALPIHMSEGFNPHPRVSFPAALAVGIASEGEICEFDLDDWVPPGDVEAAISAQMPRGLAVVSLEAISPREKGTVARSVYRVEMPEDMLPDNERIATLMASSHAIVTRKKETESREVDIRPFVATIRREGAALHLVLKTSPSGAARPEEILRALGVPEEGIKSRARITREKVILQ